MAADKGKPLPEYKGLTRDEQTRGMGGKLVSCGEENLLRSAKDRYRGRDICVHEFGHVIRNIGITSALRARFDAQFKRSMEAGRWFERHAQAPMPMNFSPNSGMCASERRETWG